MGRRGVGVCIVGPTNARLRQSLVSSFFIHEDAGRHNEGEQTCVFEIGAGAKTIIV